MKSHLVADRKSMSSVTALILFGFAVIFYIIGERSYLLPFDAGDSQMLMYLGLPISACILMALVIVIFPKKGYVVSIVPFFLAIVSVMLKAFNMNSLVGFIEIALCLVLTVVFCCTVLGAIRHKFIIILLIILFIAFHMYCYVKEEIVTTIYTFTQLSTEIGQAMMLLGFVSSLCGATRQNKIDLTLAETVVPPIPGGKPLSEMKKTPVSMNEREIIDREQTSAETTADEPVKTETAEEEPVQEKCEEVPAYETEIKAVDANNSGPDIEISATQKGIGDRISAFFRKIRKNEQTEIPVKTLEDSAEEIGIYEEKTTSSEQK